MALQINPLRSRISELCRQYSVRRLDMFGSALRDDFDSDASDVDFLVEFLESKPEGVADRYFWLLEALQSELKRPVDLVVRGAVHNPYFLQAVEQTRLNHYAAWRADLALRYSASPNGYPRSSLSGTGNTERTTLDNRAKRVARFIKSRPPPDRSPDHIRTAPAARGRPGPVWPAPVRAGALDGRAARTLRWTWISTSSTCCWTHRMKIKPLQVSNPVRRHGPGQSPSREDVLRFGTTACMASHPGQVIERISTAMSEAWQAHHHRLDNLLPRSWRSNRDEGRQSLEPTRARFSGGEKP